MKPLPTVVIVGAGFGGLAAAKALRDAPVRIYLLDRSNHHLFQPLLYQVATAMLGASEIAAPVRQLLADQKNVFLGLGQLTGIDTEKRQVLIDYLDKKSSPFDYDYLILATGASHNYFGHPEFAAFAPGLKKLRDAAVIRERILKAFELAEMEDNPREHQDLLTFVLVGGGPTGVELAGAIAELKKYTLDSDFRRIDPAWARVILIQGGDRILPSFHEDLSKAAHKRLEKLGVEIQIGAHVTHVDATGVTTEKGRVPSRTVVWTAGVTPSPVGKWLGADTDRSGRVRVAGNCEVPKFPGVFVIGDTACFEEAGTPLPGVAQVALQQGKYVGALIGSRVANTKAPGPFHYYNKGNMAVVGRNFAVIEIGWFRSAGFFAWIIWAIVHLLFLASGGNRLSVIAQWLWSYVTHQRGSRLIINPEGETAEKTPFQS